MSDKINDGGAAFPTTNDHPDFAERGMTLRVYAAIKLRVPQSGIDWLDEMTQESRRRDYAGQAMIGLLANSDNDRTGLQQLSWTADETADEVLKAVNQ